MKIMYLKWLLCQFERTDKKNRGIDHEEIFQIWTSRAENMYRDSGTSNLQIIWMSA